MLSNVEKGINILALAVLFRGSYLVSARCGILRLEHTLSQGYWIFVTRHMYALSD